MRQNDLLVGPAGAAPVVTGELDRCLVGLRAAGREEHSALRAERHGREALRELNRRHARTAAERRAVRQHTHLIHRRLDEILAPVAEVHRPESGEAVEQSLSVEHHQLAAAASDGDRRARGLEPHVVGERVDQVSQIRGSQGLVVDRRPSARVRRRVRVRSHRRDPSTRWTYCPACGPQSMRRTKTPGRAASARRPSRAPTRRPPRSCDAERGPDRVRLDRVERMPVQQRQLPHRVLDLALPGADVE